MLFAALEIAGFGGLGWVFSGFGVVFFVLFCDHLYLCWEDESADSHFHKLFSPNYQESVNVEKDKRSQQRQHNGAESHCDSRGRNN